jgi:CHAT domain-containing protein/tetratricopeptide (TPR) repeat protein
VSAKEKHLSTEQIEYLIEGHGGAQKPVPNQLIEEARNHVATCEECKGLVSVHAEGNRILRGLQESGRKEGFEDCPSTASIYRLAAGSMDSREADEILKHITECDHCGPMLREATEDLNSAESADEAATVMSLQSARPDWQKDLARELAAKSATVSNGSSVLIPKRWDWRVWFIRRERWLYVSGAAAVLCALIGGWEYWHSRPSYADRLLVEAYSEQRTLEPRIAGATQAPLKVERGGSRSRLDRPLSLLKAESIISENLRRHPDDTRWLHSRARADLLEDNYASAIESLERALEFEPDSPPLIVDLATAYFERAEAMNSDIDFGKAIELQGQILAKHPDDPLALFNRAVTYEKIHAYEQAAADWENYLRTDPTSGWADEARRRLGALREKLKTRTELRNDLKTDAAAFLEQQSAQASIRVPETNLHADEYLDVATRLWLPELLNQRTSVGDVRSANLTVLAALEALAGVLTHSHSDDWLKDVLAEPRSHTFQSGFRMLTSAIESNEGGKYDQAVGQASDAQRLFQAIRSDAGVLRAEFEKVYALDRADQGYQCLAAANPLVRGLEHHRYAWLQVQSLTEQATCRFVTGDLERSSMLANGAVELARTVGYRTLYLRALGNSASFDTVKGNLRASWARNEEGLAEYWKGSYPPARAFQFYSELSYAAESGGQPHTALAMAREAVFAIVSVGNQSVEALARYRVASLAKSVGADEEAKREIINADRLFGVLPQTASTIAYRTAGEIMNAALEARAGEFDQPLALLKRVRPALPSVANFTVPLQFYETLGDLYLKHGNYEESARALRSAISIGETAASTMTTDHERLIWNREVGEAYRELVKIWFLHESRPVDALELWESYRSIPLRSYNPSSQTARLQRTAANGIDFGRLEQGPFFESSGVRTALPNLRQVTVISYAEMPDGIAVWVFDDRGIKSHWVSVSSEILDTTIERFQRECSNPASDLELLRHDARQLYGWLIEPVSTNLDSIRDIVLEPDGMVTSVPFEALEDGFGVPLGKRLATTTSPGLAYMGQLKDTGKLTRSVTALVVSPPTLTEEISGELRTLRSAENEAQLISSSMTDVHALLGDQATIIAVKRDLPEAIIFHFAGHALFGPERSGLLLSSGKNNENGSGQSELLDVSALEHQSLGRCQLVVLSACSTGRVNVERDGDPDNLVRSFLGAGVPHIIASRWDVDSEATTKLMESFYDALFSGFSVAHALQHARNELGSRAETAHPYYWAAFVAFGRS